MFILSRQTDTASAVSSNWCVDVDDVPPIRETTMGIINNFVQFHSIVVNANHLKYISLITLTLQNAILGLSMRYARTRPGDIFLSSTGKLTKINNSGDDWEGVPAQRRLDFVLNFFFNIFLWLTWVHICCSTFMVMTNAGVSFYWIPVVFFFF